MAYYLRDLEETLVRFSKFPVVAILGPRQSGKTTLSKHFFKNYVYVNLDDLELCALFREDPKGMLRKYENEHGIIFDEFQNCPELLSYIKVIVDEKDRPGYFVLTGSQNFLMNEAITQSLAGRVGILTLLPFSLHELENNQLLKQEAPEEVLFSGGYPRLYVRPFTPEELYPSYVKTYIERDVRQLINVTNIYTFQKFLKLCAARVGQLVNFTDLATNCGINVHTVHHWLSILEASYIIFLLRPYWVNFNKRITKTPKLYFYDTGLACSLLEIESAGALAHHPMYGNLFECLVISDIQKQFLNLGKNAPLYFWRDRNGDIEVDCLIVKEAQLLPVEIKSGETYTPHFFDSIMKWNHISGQTAEKSYVVYAGTQQFSGDRGHLVPWYAAGTLVKRIKA